MPISACPWGLLQRGNGRFTALGIKSGNYDFAIICWRPRATERLSRVATGPSAFPADPPRSSHSVCGPLQSRCGAPLNGRVGWFPARLLLDSGGIKRHSRWDRSRPFSDLWKVRLSKVCSTRNGRMQNDRFYRDRPMRQLARHWLNGKIEPTQTLRSWVRMDS
jgi:hypothetical protein